MSPAERFLESLPDPARVIDGERSLVIVAHPDDETLGCAGLLTRMPGARVVVVTDGAPRNLTDAGTYGFETAADYAAARGRELAGALAIAGVPPDRLTRLELADQQVAQELVWLVRRLQRLMKSWRTEIVLTHAYEGGHPDHDGTALAVHAAVRSLRDSEAPAIVEMPFYHLGGSGMVVQRFADANGSELDIALNEHQRALKTRMIDAHATQRQTLQPFSADIERFRLSPRHDFSKLPNGGRLLYEHHDWGMTGERWKELASAALQELGQAGPAA